MCHSIVELSYNRNNKNINTNIIIVTKTLKEAIKNDNNKFNKNTKVKTQ